MTEEEYNKEIEELNNISLIDIVNYVKNSIDVIVTFKVEDLIDDYKSNKNQNSASDYETLLQKEEAAIRQHISYEHQIKIEYEKVLEKIEILELENKLLLYQIVS
jgi:ATP-dependent exoDNAse (exonuclease V) beta subunit